MIISQALEARFFPGESAIGRMVKTGSGVAEIVGEVGNIRRAALTDAPHAGTRMALGASPRSILWLVLGQGGRIAAAGALIGIGGSVVASRALRSLLFGTSATDPSIIATAAALLLVTALIACYIPARRATRIDPIKTLAPE